MNKHHRHCSAGATLILLVLFGCSIAGMTPPQQKVPVAATPPMGWNNWNHFGAEVSEDLVRAQADAMVKNGMKTAGYTYLNIDDGWAGDRDGDGFIHPNAKFPDMKGLADFIHGLGLKFGIYTAATVKTCMGLKGSRGHEEQDAETYAKWGVDFVKVDWCSDETDETLVYNEYKKLGEALRKTGRPIVYSIGAPGAAWRWGASVGGNLWRTSIDIKDNWNWMSAVGFSQNGLERFAGPGHWNDPDMIEVGNDGFDNAILGKNDAWSLRRPAPPELPGMTDDEYRTHMSLWCLLAAPLIVGADLAHLKPSALSILTNPEVIAVDQDALGMQGYRVAQEGPLEVWVKPLTGGRKAVGLFNRELGTMAVTVYFRDIRVGADARLRDLWARKDLGRFHEKYTANVAGHGVVMVQVTSEE